MKDLVISVIVPVFRVEAYLKRCVDSILNQTYKNLEIILVDDGSDDACPQICDEYARTEDRIVVIHKENGGLSSARNAGLDIAKGEYIGFVDSDDAIEADMYEVLLDTIISNDGDVVVCDFKNWDGVSDLKSKAVPNETQICSHDEMLKKFFRVEDATLYTAVWCRLYKRSVIADIRFTEGVINEDVDFSYKIFANAEKTCITNACKYKYFVANSSITRKHFTPKDLDYYTVWQNVVDLTKANDPKNLAYAELNLKRCDLTLLLKYAMFGIKGFDEPRRQIAKMKRRLRSNRKELLKSKGFSRSRKIALVLITISVGFVKFLFSAGLIKKQV